MARKKSKKKAPKPPSRSYGYLPDGDKPYDPSVYPEELVYRNTDVGQLGGDPIDGWKFELVYRYTIYQFGQLNVDWAIMTYATRPDPARPGRVERRAVERIDCCHSQIHVHTFRRSDDPADDAGQKTVLVSLTAGDAARVSREYDVQMMLHSREWPERVRRWIDG